MFFYLYALTRAVRLTYGLCGRPRRHAVFADGQSESVLNARFQLGAGDSQHGITSAQAEVQTGAVLRALQGAEISLQSYTPCFCVFTSLSLERDTQEAL